MGPLAVLCAIVSSANLATSFIIPRSLPDGDYRARYDAFGKQVIEPLTPAIMRREAERIMASGLYINASSSQSRFTTPPFGIHDPGSTAAISAVNASTTSQTSSILTSHHPHDAVVPRSNNPYSFRTRRSWCWCGTNSDHSDVEDMIQTMKTLIDAQLGHQALVPMGQSYWRKKGSVIGFICTLDRPSKSVQAVDVGVWNTGIDFLRRYCGPYIPGTYAHGGETGGGYNDYTSLVHYGFVNERFYDGHEICQHCTEPDRDHCHGCGDGKCGTNGSKNGGYGP